MPNKPSESRESTSISCWTPHTWRMFRSATNIGVSKKGGRERGVQGTEESN